MDPKRLTGPNAGSIKYDLITALSVTGMAGKPVLQTSMVRLIALVTARYNWFRDEVTVGQRDLAKMWSVDERTVKREMKRLVDANILLKLRPGVRGRVGAYRLNYREIINLSQPSWENVGPDFVERMLTIYPQSDVKVVNVDFAAKKIEPDKPETGERGIWRSIRGDLRKSDPSIFESWYGKLVFIAYTNGTLVLRAPNRFIARYIETHLDKPLMVAARTEFEGMHTLRIEVG